MKATFNPNIQKRKSTRLVGYDYSQAGLYFITICSFKKKSIFGQINQQEMVLNRLGTTADQFLKKIPEYHPTTTLHEHIVMPNHVHFIIELTIGHGLSSFQLIEPKKPQFQKLISGSVGSIILGFKSGVTTWSKTNSICQNVWQRNYHDHIIRNQESYDKIANYIINNPSNWEKDCFFMT